MDLGDDEDHGNYDAMEIWQTFSLDSSETFEGNPNDRREAYAGQVTQTTASTANQDKTVSSTSTRVPSDGSVIKPSLCDTITVRQNTTMTYGGSEQFCQLKPPSAIMGNNSDTSMQGMMTSSVSDNHAENSKPATSDPEVNSNVATKVSTFDLVKLMKLIEIKVNQNRIIAKSKRQPPPYDDDMMIVSQVESSASTYTGSSVKSIFEPSSSVEMISQCKMAVPNYTGTISRIPEPRVGGQASVSQNKMKASAGACSTDEVEVIACYDETDEVEVIAYYDETETIASSKSNSNVVVATTSHDLANGQIEERVHQNLAGIESVRIKDNNFLIPVSAGEADQNRTVSSTITDNAAQISSTNPHTAYENELSRMITVDVSTLVNLLKKVKNSRQETNQDKASSSGCADLTDNIHPAQATNGDQHVQAVDDERSQRVCSMDRCSLNQLLSMVGQSPHPTVTTPGESGQNEKRLISIDIHTMLEMLDTIQNLAETTSISMTKASVSSDMGIHVIKRNPSETSKPSQSSNSLGVTANNIPKLISTTKDNQKKNRGHQSKRGHRKRKSSGRKRQEKTIPIVTIASNASEKAARSTPRQKKRAARADYLSFGREDIKSFWRTIHNDISDDVPTEVTAHPTATPTMSIPRSIQPLVQFSENLDGSANITAATSTMLARATNMTEEQVITRSSTFPMLQTSTNIAACNPIGATPIISGSTPIISGSCTVPIQQTSTQVHGSTNIAACTPIGATPIISGSTPIISGSCTVPIQQTSTQVHGSTNIAACTPIGATPIISGSTPIISRSCTVPIQQITTILDGSTNDATSTPIGNTPIIARSAGSLTSRASPTVSRPSPALILPRHIQQTSPNLQDPIIAGTPISVRLSQSSPVLVHPGQQQTSFIMPSALGAQSITVQTGSNATPMANVTPMQNVNILPAYDVNVTPMYNVSFPINHVTHGVTVSPLGNMVSPATTTAPTFQVMSQLSAPQLLYMAQKMTPTYMIIPAQRNVVQNIGVLSPNTTALTTATPVVTGRPVVNERHKVSMPSPNTTALTTATPVVTGRPVVNERHKVSMPSPNTTALTTATPVVTGRPVVNERHKVSMPSPNTTALTTATPVVTGRPVVNERHKVSMPSPNTTALTTATPVVTGRPVVNERHKVSMPSPNTTALTTATPVVTGRPVVNERHKVSMPSPNTTALTTATPVVTGRPVVNERHKVSMPSPNTTALTTATPVVTGRPVVNERHKVSMPSPNTTALTTATPVVTGRPVVNERHKVGEHSTHELIPQTNVTLSISPVAPTNVTSMASGVMQNVNPKSVGLTSSLPPLRPSTDLLRKFCVAPATDVDENSVSSLSPRLTPSTGEGTATGLKLPIKLPSPTTDIAPSNSPADVGVLLERTAHELREADGSLAELVTQNLKLTSCINSDGYGQETVVQNVKLTSSLKYESYSALDTKQVCITSQNQTMDALIDEVVPSVATPTEGSSLAEGSPTIQNQPAVIVLPPIDTECDRTDELASLREVAPTTYQSHATTAIGASQIRSAMLADEICPRESIWSEPDLVCAVDMMDLTFCHEKKMLLEKYCSEIECLERMVDCCDKTSSTEWIECRHKPGVCVARYVDGTTVVNESFTESNSSNVHGRQPVVNQTCFTEHHKSRQAPGHEDVLENMQNSSQHSSDLTPTIAFATWPVVKRTQCYPESRQAEDVLENMQNSSQHSSRGLTPADEPLGSGNLADEPLGSGNLADEPLGSGNVANEPLGSGNLADEPLGSGNLADEPLGSGNVADEPLGSGNLADEPLGSGNLADEPLGSGNLADEPLGSGNLADEPLGSGNVADEPLGSGNVADDDIEQPHSVDTPGECFILLVCKDDNAKEANPEQCSLEDPTTWRFHEEDISGVENWCDVSNEQTEQANCGFHSELANLKAGVERIPLHLDKPVEKSSEKADSDEDDCFPEKAELLRTTTKLSMCNHKEKCTARAGGNDDDDDDHLDDGLDSLSDSSQRDHDVHVLIPDVILTFTDQSESRSSKQPNIRGTITLHGDVHPSKCITETGRTEEAITHESGHRSKVDKFRKLKMLKHCKNLIISRPDNHHSEKPCHSRNRKELTEKEVRHWHKSGSKRVYSKPAETIPRNCVGERVLQSKSRSEIHELSSDNPKIGSNMFCLDDRLTSCHPQKYSPENDCSAKLTNAVDECSPGNASNVKHHVNRTWSDHCERQSTYRPSSKAAGLCPNGSSETLSAKMENAVKSKEHSTKSNENPHPSVQCKRLQIDIDDLKRIWKEAFSKQKQHSVVLGKTDRQENKISRTMPSDASSAKVQNSEEDTYFTSGRRVNNHSRLSDAETIPVSKPNQLKHDEQASLPDVSPEEKSTGKSVSNKSVNVEHSQRKEHATTLDHLPSSKMVSVSEIPSEEIQSKQPVVSIAEDPREKTLSDIETRDSDRYLDTFKKCCTESGGTSPHSHGKSVKRKHTKLSPLQGDGKHSRKSGSDTEHSDKRSRQIGVYSRKNHEHSKHVKLVLGSQHEKSSRKGGQFNQVKCEIRMDILPLPIRDINSDERSTGLEGIHPDIVSMSAEKISKSSNSRQVIGESAETQSSPEKSGLHMKCCMETNGSIRDGSCADSSSSAKKIKRPIHSSIGGKNIFLELNKLKCQTREDRSSGISSPKASNKENRLELSSPTKDKYLKRHSSETSASLEKCSGKSVDSAHSGGEATTDGRNSCSITPCENDGHSEQNASNKGLSVKVTNLSNVWQSWTKPNKSNHQKKSSPIHTDEDQLEKSVSKRKYSKKAIKPGSASLETPDRLNPDKMKCANKTTTSYSYPTIADKVKNCVRQAKKTSLCPMGIQKATKDVHKSSPVKLDKLKTFCKSTFGQGEENDCTAKSRSHSKHPKNHKRVVADFGDLKPDETVASASPCGPRSSKLKHSKRNAESKYSQFEPCDVQLDILSASLLTQTSLRSTELKRKRDTYSDIFINTCSKKMPKPAIGIVKRLVKMTPKPGSVQLAKNRWSTPRHGDHWNNPASSLTKSLVCDCSVVMSRDVKLEKHLASGCPRLTIDGIKFWFGSSRKLVSRDQEWPGTLRMQKRVQKVNNKESFSSVSLGDSDVETSAALDVEVLNTGAPSESDGEEMSNISELGYLESKVSFQESDGETCREPSEDSIIVCDDETSEEEASKESEELTSEESNEETIVTSDEKVPSQDSDDQPSIESSEELPQETEEEVWPMTSDGESSHDDTLYSKKKSKSPKSKTKLKPQKVAERRQILCAECPAQFTRLGDLVRHMRVHETFSCTKCEENFRYLFKLYRHMKTIHSTYTATVASDRNNERAVESAIRDDFQR